MSTFDVKSDQPSVSTLEDFEAVWALFKEQEPEKYAMYLENGEIERQRKLLGIPKRVELTEEHKKLGRPLKKADE